ncbi:phage portal protein [Palleronia caenipelagi]|nr:phage portal protein [Palleronia caenipelagi]
MGVEGQSFLSGSGPWPLGGMVSRAGPTVSAKTSLEHSAVWGCVRKTAEMISTLPVDLFRKSANGSRDKIDSDLAEIIKENPNADQTAPEFWEGMVAQTLLQGNAFAEKLYIGNRFVGLRPMLGCKPDRRPDRAFQYVVIDRGKREVLPAEKVFHLRGFGAGDGLGMSVVRYGANSIGAALAADETASSVFSNSAMPSGVIQSDQTLNAGQRKQLEAMLATYSGSQRAGKLMTLEAGLKFQQLQMNPEDAQLLDTRRFSVEDICRWFGVPPIVIGHASEGQTMWGSGVEAILLSWLTLGINPFLIRLEQRLKKDLIPVQTRRRDYFEYNREAMIQMDSKAKGDLMLKLGMGGTMTANERRARLNLPRHDDANADALLMQTAMSPMELLGKDQS